MPRPYHSPSSLALGRRCPRAWAYCYLEGMRDPEVPWVESWATALPADVTPRTRSTALGKAMHTVGESWYLHRAVDWTTYPSRVFLSGAHLLPHPDRVHDVHVERAIGTVPLPPGAAHAPRTALEVHGVRFAGYVDLLVQPHWSETERLGLPRGWLLADYKSTASIARYALTSAALLADVQANLYALDACERLRVDAVPARWVYFETKRKRIALPVDVTITRTAALDVLAPAAELARYLDTIENVDDAPANPDACQDYGGCVYHVSRGGPCTARRNLGKSIALRASKKGKIVMTPEMQAKLDALKGGTTTTVEPTTETASTAAKPARGRPKASPKAGAGSLAETMSTLVDELTAAQALVDDVRARMVEALA